MNETQLPATTPATGFSHADLELANQFLEPLWEVEPAAVPEAAFARFQQIGGREGTAVSAARDAIAHAGVGFRSIPSGDIAGAFQNFVHAAQLFAELQQQDGFVVTSAFAKYFEGVIEAQKGNIAGAQEKMAQAEELLKTAGGLAGHYQGLLDLFKPDILFLTGMSSLQRQDFETGRAWIEQAAAAYAKLAQGVTAEAPKHLFAGMSDFYRTIYDFAASIRNLNVCRYDTLIEESSDVRKRSTAAIESLEKAHASGVQFPPHVLPMARGIRDTLNVIPAIAGVMTSVFHSKFSSDIPELADAKKGLQAATASFAAAGEQAVPLLRNAQQLSQMIDNVLLLAKPTGWHIVLLGGIITACLFVPILFGVSWTYDKFHWGAPPLQIAGLALLAAAIAGYGASALKLLPAVLSGGKLRA